jgi:hypothetical protein
MIAAALGAVLSGYDEWRSAFYIGGMESAADWWFERTENVVLIRLPAPALAGVRVLQLATLRLPLARRCSTRRDDGSHVTPI